MVIERQNETIDKLIKLTETGAKRGNVETQPNTPQSAQKPVKRPTAATNTKLAACVEYLTQRPTDVNKSSRELARTVMVNGETFSHTYWNKAKKSL